MTLHTCTKLGLWLLVVSSLVVLAGCGSNNTDELAPSLTFDGVNHGAIVSTTTPTRTLSGTTDPGATISITINDVAVSSADISVLATGEWSSTITLNPGANLVTVAAADATGNQALFSLSLTYDAVSIETYATPIPTGSLTISGLVDGVNYTAPLEVTVTPADTTVAPATFVANVDLVENTWSANLTGLAVGANEIKISNDVTGVASNPVETLVTITVDAGAPVVSIDQPITKVVVPSQTLTGGSDLTATSVSVSPLPVGGTPTIDSVTGDWSASIEGLMIGKNPVTATVVTGSGSATARSLLIVEQQPPLITRVSPAENALDVAVDAVITAVFQVDMDETTIDNTSFTLNGGAVSAGVAYDATTRTATLTPDVSLTAATSYVVDLTTAVKDANGNNLAQALSWNFTTL